MDIKLDSKYSIESSRYSFDLYWVDKNGRKFFEGYYSTLKEALKGYLKLKIKQSNANSIQNLLVYIKHLENSCCKALARLELKGEVSYE